MFIYPKDVAGEVERKRKNQTQTQLKTKTSQSVESIFRIVLVYSGPVTNFPTSSQSPKISATVKAELCLIQQLGAVPALRGGGWQGHRSLSVLCRTGL